jgi:hypothetical protein
MSEQDHFELDDARAACRQFDLELPAYLEGEDRPAVPAHARECVYCSVLLADLEQAVFASHHLPIDEPPARVWANIRARLASEGLIREQVSGWGRWLQHQVLRPASASAGALACLTILSVFLLSPADSGLKKASGWLSPGTTPAVATASVLGTDTELLKTLRQMEESYQALEATLDPNLKATYRQSLGTLDDCIRECVTHCQRQPTDTLAREYLLNAYRAKAQVLASALQFDGR